MGAHLGALSCRAMRCGACCTSSWDPHVGDLPQHQALSLQTSMHSFGLAPLPLDQSKLTCVTRFLILRHAAPYSRP